MVNRIFVEKKQAYRVDAKAKLNDLRSFLGIKNLSGLRVVNCYDVEDLDAELLELSKRTVFGEPQLDDVTDAVKIAAGDTVIAYEYLPGQFDQRADSAAQCIQLLSGGERPKLRSSTVLVLSGKLTEIDVNAIKKYVINPVESRETDLSKPQTLAMDFDKPANIEVLEGFNELSREDLVGFISARGLAMDADDIAFCQSYFKSEGRNPTITEIKVLDTYWSDHCRHTTFLTNIDSVAFADERVQRAYERYISIRKELGVVKPVTLMDIATIGGKYLKRTGRLPNIDESEEINACTVKIKVDVDGEKQDWLLLFKNETHNHPTEIEPFGGAATCIGGAIRDPLSGRSYVYQAMRVTGAANPLRTMEETLGGKLPQRKIVTTAAAGYSSYGNQIGLATGLVDEIYHDGYVAKRMEIGAVLGAAPAKNVIRLQPEAGDKVILLGGRTGRDGCGGATGSSKSHSLKSLSTCAAEVQKGNAPEERKLQRLFRNTEATRLIKRCNDFGAGGVSVAVGELADGLNINLDMVPKKYDGLDGTELAISESQERMAVVVAPKDEAAFMALAHAENLQAVTIAEVQAEPRLRMYWQGEEIVNLSREFLGSNGAPKHAAVEVGKGQCFKRGINGGFAENMESLVSDLNVCSKRGLSEMFDSTIGGGTVLMPFGGKYQRTPIQSMSAKLPVQGGHTDTCTLFSYGYNPYVSEKNQYAGAYLAVIEAVSKLIAEGGNLDNCYMTFQEYFERLKDKPERWGKPMASLLGALDAQLDLGIAAIGGKDSMSGTFEGIDVPPTLVAFAVTTTEAKLVISPEFKKEGHRVALFAPQYEKGIPAVESLKSVYAAVRELIEKGAAVSAYTLGYGGIAEAVYKMTLGNGVGFKFADEDVEGLFDYGYGSFIVELTEGEDGKTLGYTTADGRLTCGGEEVELALLNNLYEGKLESVFKCNIVTHDDGITSLTYNSNKQFNSAKSIVKPRVVIPVFPGTNCEYDTARAFERAGAEAKILVVKNLSAADISDSAKEFARLAQDSQVIFIPGGFSAGDEPEGSGKFIVSFFKNPLVAETVAKHLEVNDGLMGGICNGFQALIKLGLVPFGKIIDTDDKCPTLTFNTIGRHQSKLVRTRIASNKSPWLMDAGVGNVYTEPVSHGEGRFVCSEELLKKLIQNGQISTQYVDLEGKPTMDVAFNPNGSVMAIEGILSPNGRVFGKMAHSERMDSYLYKNVEGVYGNGMFTSAVKYYK